MASIIQKNDINYPQNKEQPSMQEWTGAWLPQESSNKTQQKIQQYFFEVLGPCLGQESPYYLFSLLCPSHSFKYFIAGKTFYHLLDLGISNILALESLNHGTNLANNLSIRLHGANPEFGGSKNGSTFFWTDYNATNYFYAFKDKQLPSSSYNNLLQRKAFTHFIGPCLHNFLSHYNLVNKSLNIFPHNEANSLVKKTLFCAEALLGTLISPTLRFRFSEIDPHRFENDPDYAGFAYRTKQSIEPWRIGLIGSLAVGINSNWSSRAKQNPSQVLLGTIQLVAAASLAVLSSNDLIPTMLGALSA